MTGEIQNIRFTFSRQERLKSRKRLEELFSRRLFIQHPILRIYYQQTILEPDYPAQFAFSVSRKFFPNATDRNRMKRLMRESVRHFKPEFYKALQEKNKQYVLLLSYQSGKIANLQEVDHAVQQLLLKIARA